MEEMLASTVLKKQKWKLFSGEGNETLGRLEERLAQIKKKAIEAFLRRRGEKTGKTEKTGK